MRKRDEDLKKINEELAKREIQTKIQTLKNLSTEELRRKKDEVWHKIKEIDRTISRFKVDTEAVYCDIERQNRMKEVVALQRLREIYTPKLQELNEEDDLIRSILYERS